MWSERWIESPIGRLRLVASDAGLAAVLHARQSAPPSEAAAPGRSGWVVIEEATGQIGEYFAGRRAAFDLPLAPLAGTDFQRAVWGELGRIPPGETIAYAELARRVGRPRAIRAVGHANARNPLSIVVPCHRVIGADGTLTGYAGGLEAKRWLLAHEAVYVRVRPSAVASTP